MTTPYEHYDVLILGAGASGLTCAITAGSRGFSCAALDQSSVAGKKIRIAGGGKANVTNLNMRPSFYISANPKFCQKVLGGYPPQTVLALLKQYGIPWEVRSHDQVFCTVQASRLVARLVQHCNDVGAKLWFKQRILEVTNNKDFFIVKTTSKIFRAPRLVIALGSLARPSAGGSDYGLTLARQRGHAIVPTRPALVPLTLDAKEKTFRLSGISLPVNLHVGEDRKRRIIDYPLLFTHKGLSGPAILQASCFWEKGKTIAIDFLPNVSLIEQMHTQNTAATTVNFMKKYLPQRLVQTFVPQDIQKQRVSELPKSARKHLADITHNYTVKPLGTEGIEKAEVMAGGVDTREVHPHTLESLLQKNLYFTGEALDITGMLGGYNLHWAWASGYAVGRALKK